MTLPVFVLDAWAILAWLLAERPGCVVVQGLLDKASRDECLVSASIINLGEVDYSLRRRHGDVLATRARRALFSAPIAIHPVPDDLVWEAAALKSEFRISYADGFAAALAMRLDAILVTGDPEFEALAKAGRIRLMLLGRGR